MGDVRQFPDVSDESERGSQAFIVLGWIFAVISLVFVPPLFGALGVAMGIIANKKGNRGGIAVIIASIIGAAIGLIMGAVLLTYLRLFLGVFFMTS